MRSRSLGYHTQYSSASEHPHPGTNYVGTHGTYLDARTRDPDVVLIFNTHMLSAVVVLHAHFMSHASLVIQLTHLPLVRVQYNMGQV